jgi:hypothetical protein
MNRESSLSVFLQNYLNHVRFADVEWPDLSAEKTRKLQQAVDDIVKCIIYSRESLANEAFQPLDSLVQTEPEFIENILNDHFTREVIDSVPGYVERTIQLSRLEASVPPSQVTSCYVREAIRTYILGLPQASVALSRAALEQALKERIGYQGSHTPVEMHDLLDEAETAGIIDRTVRKMAREVANEANQVLHEKPISLTRAYEVLVKLRGVLQHVYAES